MNYLKIRNEDLAYVQELIDEIPSNEKLESLFDQIVIDFESLQRRFEITIDNLKYTAKVYYKNIYVGNVCIKYHEEGGCTIKTLSAPLRNKNV